MAEEGSVITQEMQDAIGKEGTPSTLEVEKSSIRMFARAVGHTDPVFFDEEVAKQRGHRTLPAPPGYLGTPIFSPTSQQEGAGPRWGPYSRRLNGGTEIEQVNQIYAGDVLTSRSRIVSFTERTGGMGPMLITVSETVYTNADGKTMAISRGTLISY